MATRLDLTATERRLAAARVYWRQQAHDQQLPPEGHDWYLWFLLGGRGAGKTRAGAEWLADQLALDHEGDVSAIIAPTFGEGRDKCIEGVSGLLRALRRRGVGIRTWNRSIGELWLTSGAKVLIDEAYTGAVKVQGENLRRAWCDELRNWRPGWAEQAWDESLLPAVRVGSHPCIVITSTPRRVGLVRRLLADPEVRVARMTMFENVDNLSAAFLEQMRRRYEGTRLGRQELYGELIEDVEGALWKADMIEHADTLPNGGWGSMPRIGVDPADGEEDGAEHAYTVAALARNHRLYVVEHKGVRESPYGFACEVVRAAAAHHGEIVWERNHGGRAFVQLVHRAMADLGMVVPMREVWASEGKRTRAEPVAALYEQRRVVHLGYWPELEDQMTSWTGARGETSPDRLDSLVWALSSYVGASFKPPPFEDGAVPYGGQVADGAVPYGIYQDEREAATPWT